MGVENCSLGSPLELGTIPVNYMQVRGGKQPLNEMNKQTYSAAATAKRDNKNITHTYNQQIDCKHRLLLLLVSDWPAGDSSCPLLVATFHAQIFENLSSYSALKRLFDGQKIIMHILTTYLLSCITCLVCGSNSWSTSVLAYINGIYSATTIKSRTKKFVRSLQTPLKIGRGIRKWLLETSQKFR